MKRFPTSIRGMRAKFPEGPIVQLRVITAKDSIVEVEGATTKERLDEILKLALEGFEEIREAKKAKKTA